MPAYNLNHVYNVFVNGLDITGLLVGLIWEENAAEIAARAHVTIAFDHTVQESLLDNLQLSNVIQITADKYDVVFTGIVFDWDYTISDPTQVTVVAYSPAIYLTRSKENYLFNGGLSGTTYTVRSAIKKIASDWNIIAGDWDFPDGQITKPMYKREKIADIIFDLLEQSRMQTSAEIVVRNVGLALDITKPGKNTNQYQFHMANVVSMHGRWDMLDLVTQVKIYEGGLGAGSGGLGGTGTGNTPQSARIVQGPYVGKYGVMQEIVNSSAALEDDDDDGGGDDPADEQASEILLLRGEPRHVQRIMAPDIPLIRKGDAHLFDVGPLRSEKTGPFIVSGIRHDVTSGIMTIEIGTSDFKRSRSSVVKPSGGLVIPEDPPGVGAAPGTQPVGGTVGVGGGIGTTGPGGQNQ